MSEMNPAYALFAYEMYYPEGGMNDLVGCFQTAEEAIAEGEKRMNPRYSMRADGYQVVRLGLRNLEIVATRQR